MNIIWFTWKDLDNPLAGGAEVVNEELAARAAADGHHVTFLVAGFPGAPRTARRRGFDIIRTGSRFTNYLTAARYFLTHRRELEPDLVIDECNTMPYFAGYYAKTRTILLFHMLCRRIWFYEFPWPLALLGYIAEPVYLRLLGPKQNVVAVSDSTRRDLVRCGYPANGVKIITEGIRLKPADSLERIKKHDQPTLLSLGNIRRMKRTLDQVKAFELAKDAIPDLRLVVAGEASGSYGRRVTGYIKRSRYASSIEYVGRTSEEEKVNLMRTSHLLLVTSVKEGWGLTVTEAASQCTPAIVYNVDGLRDSVRHNETGLITTKNTPEQMSHEIMQLLGDPVRYNKLRRSGWQWSKEKNFDLAYADFSLVIAAN